MATNPEQKSTSLAELRENLQPSTAVVRAGFTDSASFELAQRAAKALASSDLVPNNYQGNIPNCLIALEMAQRIGASPLMVAQSLYVVHGRPAWSAKFLIASWNSCGRFSAIRYKFQGTEGKDDWGCRAYAVELSSGETLTGPLITIALAKAEKWYDRNGSKWKTIPELMLRYRAAAWFVNTHAPEISMGLNTAEEIHDVYDAALDPDTGAYEVTTETLREVVQEAVEPEPDADEGQLDLTGGDAPAPTKKATKAMIEKHVEKLGKAPDHATLQMSWVTAKRELEKGGYAMPPEIEGTYLDMRESLAEREAQ